MADVITRFKLETSQYDSKLRDASKSLSEYSRTAAIAGSEFDKFTKSNVEAARAFGSIETGAKNAKDKVKELVSAYNDIAKAYNALTKEQQQSDFGKAMASSLQQLKGRITEAKKELYDLGDSAKSTGGMMGALKDKFMITIDATKAFDLALQAAKGALNVVKDALFSNEVALDEWGRITASCESVYNGFLDALNTGDISGFLNNIDDIINAASSAYDALDELNTFNAFNQINRKKLQSSFNTKIADYREGSASKEDVKEASKAYIKNLREEGQYQINAYLNEVQKIAKNRGVDFADLMSAVGGDYGDFKTLKHTRVPYKVTKNWINNMSRIEYTPTNKREEIAYAVQRLNDTELQALQGLGATFYGTRDQIASVRKQTARILNGRGAGGSGGGGGGRGGAAYDPRTQALVIGAYTSPLAGVSTGWGPETPETRMANWLKNLGAPAGLTFSEATDSARANAQKEIQKEAFKEGMASFTENFGKMTSSISQIASGVQQLGVKVPAGINRMLNVLQAITSIVSAIQTLNTIKGWFSTGGVVKAADGYTVPGNYGYDRVPAMLTSGEVVLNRSQVSRLAGVLQDRAQGGGGAGSVRVSGEDIYIAVTNYLSRRGYGEIAVGR